MYIIALKSKYKFIILKYEIRLFIWKKHKGKMVNYLKSFPLINFPLQQLQ